MADSTRKRSVLEEIKTITKNCTESRRESNKIVNIIEHSETEDKDVALACIKSFNKIFQQLFASGEMHMDRHILNKEDVDCLSKEEKFKFWLTECYENVQERLVQLLQSSDETVQEMSLCTLMKLIEAEGQNPIWKIDSYKSAFPVTLYERVLRTLCTCDNGQKVLGRFGEYLDYDDVRYYTLKFVHSYLLAQQKKEIKDTYLINVFTLLENVSFPVVEDQELSNFMSRKPEVSEENPEKMMQLKMHKRSFTGAWVSLLQFKLPTSLYRKVLIILHDKVMPFMTNPLMLSDFLIESYNIGGAISLLALNGLFILVHKYNLTYPDFYGKLYALFEPSIFHVKYRARFFFLSDLFLTSTHLPAYLVGAFAKRLARISLTAPVSGLTVSIPFIYNLINRHPNCKALLHKPDSQLDIENDPYDYDETDPAQCRAMESSLWELKTLQSHYNPDVAKSAQRIENLVQPTETDLSQLYDTSYDDLFEKETRKKMKLVHTNFNQPKGLLWHKDDRLRLCWTLE